MTEVSAGIPKYGKDNSWAEVDKVHLQYSSDHTYSPCRSQCDHLSSKGLPLPHEGYRANHNHDPNEFSSKNLL